MNSRERVIAAIRFKSPDRIPVDLWAQPAVYLKYGKKIDNFRHGIDDGLCGNTQGVTEFRRYVQIVKTMLRKLHWCNYCVHK